MPAPQVKRYDKPFKQHAVENLFTHLMARSFASLARSFCGNTFTPQMTLH